MTAVKVSRKDMIEAELSRIAEEDPKHMLRAEAIVDYARKNTKSALHSKFPWNDAEAAHLKRLDIARGIIRVYKIVVNQDRPEKVRRWISLTADRANGGGYRMTVEILSDEVRRQQLKNDFYRTLKNAINRFAEFRGIFPELFAAMDDVIAESRKATA